jgi:DNA-binding transcriptional regulator YiaG
MEITAKQILNKLVNKHKLTDEEIAVKLHRKAITIYRWRTGQFEPSYAEWKMLDRILRGYNNAVK